MLLGQAGHTPINSEGQISEEFSPVDSRLCLSREHRMEANAHKVDADTHAGSQVITGYARGGLDYREFIVQIFAELWLLGVLLWRGPFEAAPSGYE